MSYYCRQNNTDFFAPAEKLGAMFEALKTLSAKALAEGKTFRYITMSRLAGVTSLEAYFKEWGWEVRRDSDGNFDAIHQISDNLGNEIKLFEAIAPFVKPGSFIEMTGNEGESWRWFFDGITCLEQTPKIAYASTGSAPVDVEA